MSTPPTDTVTHPEQIISELRREVAERTAERDEAEAQKAAMAEVVGIINSSPGDLTPVFEAMLEKALHLCSSSFGFMADYDGEYVRVVAERGIPAKLAEFHREPYRVVAGTPMDRFLQGEEVFHVVDAMSDPSKVSPRGQPYVDLGGARSFLAVPMRKDGGLLGCFLVFRQHVEAFSAKQIALLQNFAAQAVIAMENARLITETREALEQQTATAEVLGVINSSPGDLAPVFDAVLEKATRLCDAVFGNLWTYDGEFARFAAARGATPEFLAGLMQAGPQKPEPGNSLMRLAQGEPLVHIADITSEGPFQSATRRRFAEGTGARTALWVPLRKDGLLLGFFSVYRTEVRPFSDKQIALLQNFAAQAVIAMENARLITETREALEQQTATSEVLRVINSSPGDLSPVFDSIAETAARLCATEIAGLAILDGDVYRYVALRSVDPAWDEYARRLCFTAGRGTATGRTLLERNVIHIRDLADDPELEVPEIGTIGRLRTFLGVPLLREGEPIGVLALSRTHVEPFTERQIELVRTFADQAVIAMDNARLLGDLRERTGELEESLEYQTATSDVLKVISRSAFDQQPVLDTVAATACRLCDAEMSLISRYEGGVCRLAANYGYPPELEIARRNRPHSPGRDSVTGRVLMEGNIVHVADVMADREYDNPESVQLAKARTVLGVPLSREGVVLGVIVVTRQRVEPFTERQIELIRTFADQAVIAIENARLLDELRQRTDEVAELNRGLEARVAEQVDELGRVGRLERFLAPQLAELIVSQGDEKILESHRREIVVVFCDLRGYTAFTETAEPEEVLDFLREYHGALGPLVSQFEGTLDQFSGDGIMVFFNDPVPIPDPAERAVNMAVAMREAAGTLIVDWRERGRDLGFGAGIAQGYATLGQIGFSERSGYTAIGTVCNVAARLCAEAKDGQILLSQRVNVALKGSVPTEQVGALALKGLTQPVVAYNVPLAVTQPALRVIEGGPRSD